MKILVLSLLRLGDVFLAAPALAGIKRKYPQSELHVLINRQAAGACELIPQVDQWHFFERELLQQKLVDAESPVLEPFFRLERMLSHLRHENFDLILNFTHNRLSGWLCGAIEGRQTIGLSLDAHGRAQFGSHWFQYLNNMADERGGESFHYSDIFCFAAGVHTDRRVWSWQISEKAKQEAGQFLTTKNKRIVVQPFTSDAKKEWKTESWCQTLKALSHQCVDHEFLILAAPNEQERCAQLVQELKNHSVNAINATCSLGAAVELLNHADLFLTTDTSIKHLAAALPVAVIELSLGSSDWRRTGVYKANSYILQPILSCTPCPHSSTCSQPTHLCASLLRPELVAQFSLAVLQKNNQSIQSISQENSNQIEIYKTGFCEGGYWQSIPLGKKLESKTLRQFLDKLTSKMILQGEHLDPLGAYGTEAYRLGEWLRRQYPELDAQSWQQLIHGIESDNQEHQQTASQALKKLQSMVASSRQSAMVDLKDMRLLQNKVEDISRRLEIRHRLVRSLKSVVEETL